MIRCLCRAHLAHGNRLFPKVSRTQPFGEPRVVLALPRSHLSKIANLRSHNTVAVPSEESVHEYQPGFQKPTRDESFRQFSRRDQVSGGRQSFTDGADTKQPPQKAVQSIDQHVASTDNPQQTSTAEEDRYWTKVPQWSDITAETFMSQEWQTKNYVERTKLEHFLRSVLPEVLPESRDPLLQHLKTREDFIQDVKGAQKMTTMAVKLSPHIFTCINWKDPLNDPIRLQFMPLKSNVLPDHPSLTMDSLNEEDDSPVKGLVHRYPGKALFLATSSCPVYCSFCTRAYAVGPETCTTGKKRAQRPTPKRWEVMFNYIENTPSLRDIVVSGGDTYMLEPDSLREIGERLLSIPHIRRFRVASKGLAVNPGRILDGNDRWASTLIDLANQGRKRGKQVCWHTHFNHPNEITWITKKAAEHLCQQGLIIRNQTVLLKGVNDDYGTLSTLINTLADMNIEPYYVYICDLVKGVEHLRTTLQKLLDLDKEIRGTLTGFMTPDFVVDLPGGGGKRLAHTFESYSETTGVSTWRAPGLKGKKGTDIYTYYDPRPWTPSPENVARLHQQQDLMQKYTSTREEVFMQGYEDTGVSSLAATAAP